MSQIRILHLTDTHILSDSKYSNDSIFKNFEEKKYSTIKSLQQVLEDGKNNFKNIDCVFLTGDLIHEGQEEDYRILKDFMEEKFKLPIFYVLGNHDRTQAFNLAFNYPKKSEEYYYSSRLKGIRIVGLDSSHDNSGVGKISEQQLSWLDKEFDNDKDTPTAVLMHHPLEMIKVNVNTTSEASAHMFLSNSNDLLEVLKKGNVVGVFSGHTHSNFVSQSQGISNFVNSGTAFYGQFDSNKFTMINRSSYGIATISSSASNYQSYFVQEKEKIELLSF